MHIKSHCVRKKAPAKRMSQRKFDEKVLLLVVKTISLLENPSFINLFQGLEVKVLYRRAAVSRIIDIWHVEETKNTIENKRFSGLVFWIDQEFQVYVLPCHAKSSKVSMTIMLVSPKAYTASRTNSKFLKKIIVRMVTDNRYLKGFRTFGVGAAPIVMLCEEEHEEGI